jgi:hypothetical protein
MKRFIHISMILLASLFIAGCQEESVEIINTPALDSSTVSPAANESGTVRAYVGTEVTASGFNLDKVTDVMVNEAKAEIVSQTIKTISFRMPAMEFAQQDAPYNVVIKAFDGDKVVFTHNYYLTIPVTDALVSGYEPKTGTVGQVVTISGRNLEQVTAVLFNDVQVSAEAFVEIKADVVKVAVPALPAEAGRASVAIKAVWGAGNQIDVTGEQPFTLNVPFFNAYTQTEPAKLSDEIILTGVNLDLVQKVTWGAVELLIAEQAAESMTVKIPTSIEKQDPVVAKAALAAVYGEPAQTVTVAAEFLVDTTPMGPAAPVFASAAPSDNAYTGFYLAKEVTVSGANFASIEKFEVDGIEVELSEPATDIAAKFVMPSTITGTQAKDVTLVAIWNGGNRAEFGTIKVHPFYYTKGLSMRLGSHSKSSYPAENRDAAFLLLDEGRMISVDEFAAGVDAPAMSGSNNVVASNKTNTGVTAEQYYAVQPYLFATSSSSHKLAFQNPANSDSQLKNHRYEDGTSLPSTYGTPIIFMGVLKDEVDNAVKAEVKAGALTDILSTEKFGGASAPAYGTAEGDTWVKGSVIRVQYVTFDHASGTGGKPTAPEHVHKTGYIYITDVTCGDPDTGKALASREGYIEFDLYWSNVITE